MIVPRVVDERPYDGFALIVPLPNLRRWQCNVNARRDAAFHSFTVEVRVFTWRDDGADDG